LALKGHNINILNSSHEISSTLLKRKYVTRKHAIKQSPPRYVSEHPRRHDGDYSQLYYSSLHASYSYKEQHFQAEGVRFHIH